MNNDENGFVLLEFLMEGLTVVGLLLVLSMIGIQSAVAINGVSDSREQARFDVLQRDLENLGAHEAIYYSEARAFAASPEALGFAPSDGVEIDVEASVYGWSATARHVSMGSERGCTVFFGAGNIPTRPIAPTVSGVVACTD
jgi:type II secretory pathway pseudopilin PulG